MALKFCLCIFHHFVFPKMKYALKCVELTAKISAMNFKQQGAISFEDKIKAILRRSIEESIYFFYINFNIF